MKKIVTSIAVCSLAVCAFVSCGSKSEGKNKAASIVGKWALSGVDNQEVESAGLIFHENGNGSMYEDSSSMFHFEDEGFSVGGSVISNDYVKEEGDTVTVDVMGEKILVMKKLGNNEGYYGEYTLEGGKLYDNFAESMKEEAEKNGKPLDITLNFEGSHSELIFNNIFTYTIDDKKLNISGSSAIFNSDGSALSGDYTINGDTLTITDSKKTDTLTRVK
ncbi:hypothetical protein [Ruminococcus sp.]|uniref:hypothetical protein n=1 Tax=Ruminococcus sp. TaxID=41978 RepID=UPI0025F5CFC7|nr:hypothetical protein [Ruminococcus sp.]